MMRFFRKYRNQILIVGLPLLLVIFLIPDAISQIGQYSASAGRTMGTYVALDGSTEEIDGAEYAEAQKELRVLKEGLPIDTLMLLTGQDVKEPEHWMLLVEEARQHGLVGGVDDATSAAGDLAARLAQLAGGGSIEPEMLIQQMSASAQLPIRDVQRALTHARAVQRLIELYAGAGKLSDRRIQHSAQEMLQGVDARVFVIPAKPTTEGLSEPTAEELEAQLQAHASSQPGEGERGFGYMLPDRVRLEWLAVDAATVRNALADSEQLSNLELRKYWLRHKNEFRPAGTPADAEITFEQVREQVRERRLNELTTETLAEMLRFAESELTAPTRLLERDGMHFELPEDWESKRLRLDELALAMQERFGAGLPAYEKQGEDEWTSAEDAMALPGIGMARTDRFGRSQRLSDLIPLLKEFGGDDHVALQEAVAGPPLILGDGSFYLFRVIDTQEAHAPGSVEEVRPQLVDDLKRIEDYERLVGLKDQVRAQVLEQGMEAAASEYGTFPQVHRNIGYAPDQSQLAQRFERNNTTFPRPVLRHEDAIEEVVHRGKALIDRMLESGESFESIPLADRTFVVEVPDRLALLVAQITDLRPLVREDLAAYVFPVGQIVLMQEMGDDVTNPFSWDKVQSRFHYVSEGRNEEDDAAAPEGETSPQDGEPGGEDEEQPVEPA